MYTYPIRIVNSRCLHETTLKAEVIAHLYLPCSLSQVAMFVRKTTLKVERIDCVYTPNKLGDSRCLHDTHRRVWAIFRVYLLSPPSQLALCVINNSCSGSNKTTVLTSVPNFPSQLELFRTRQLLRLRRLSLYTYQVRLVNSHCLYKTTHKVEPIDLYTYPIRLST
jgi:hypothetical protein